MRGRVEENIHQLTGKVAKVLDQTVNKGARICGKNKQQLLSEAVTDKH